MIDHDDIHFLDDSTCGALWADLPIARVMRERCPCGCACEEACGCEPPADPEDQ